MKKIVAIVLTCTLLIGIAGCSGSQPASSSQQTGSEEQKADDNIDNTQNDQHAAAPESADGASGGGKVAIITNTVSQNEEEYRSAQEMVSKYGGRIVHVTWPDNFMQEQEQVISIVSRLASNPEIKGLVLNQAVPGSNAAVDKLLETRDDIFIVYVTPQENPPDVAQRAQIIIQPDELEMGNQVPVQAKKMGAKTLVHYSFPRHMSQPLLSSRRDLMKAKCEEIGIEFVDATAPDPTSDVGVPGAQQFILEDVIKMVDKYGKDTAFFSTNCAMQIPLIKAVVDTGAIYPQPCCPSPYHGFPAALGIESNTEAPDNLQYVIDETKRIVAEKGETGRLSTWPVPIAMMATVAGTEYAMKVIDGEVPFDKLDKAVLEQSMSDYAKTSVTTNPYVDENGNEYPTYLFVLMDFLTY